MSTVLEQAVGKALQGRRDLGSVLYDTARSVPAAAADFMTTDYLSLASNSDLRHEYLKSLETAPYLFGARGSRGGGGTGLEHLSLEEYFRDVFNVRNAMVFNSGYIANLAFVGSVPQPGDVFLFDTLIHASIHEGMRMSRVKAMVTFEHNSVESLEESLKKILVDYPQIAARSATLFVMVESTYSMDGGLCPLVEVVDMVEKYIPRESAHIVVDEAHSIGLYGPQGKGLVALWGLQERVHTTVYPLTKGPNFVGAVVVTLPIITSYLANYARSLIFSTALPYVDIIAIRHCFNLVMGPIGDEKRQKLQSNARFFLQTLKDTLKDVPAHLISFPNRTSTPENHGLASPIFPIVSSRILSLHGYMKKHGYSLLAVSFPVVPKGKDRLRVMIHAGNTEKEMTDFVRLMRNWAMLELRNGGKGTQDGAVAKL